MTTTQSSGEDVGCAWRLRPTDVARAVLGAALVLRPDLPVMLFGIERTEGTVVATRLLGGRWLAQAMLGAFAARRGPAARMWAGWFDVAVEVTHATSMLALGVFAPRRARPAAMSAAVACALAGADARATARLRERAGA